jgi:thiamine-monophosphate kinase
MESDFIQWLRQQLPSSDRLALGPGDDAAVLRIADGADCVVTTDLLTDQVDFVLTDVDPQRVGHKALAVNLSDLAAMAARPVAVVVSLALPHKGAMELARALYSGMLPLAERSGVVIAGGDTNSWDGPLVISVTAVGETTDHGPLTRRGAQPGDRILVTGELGGSILGRHLDVEPRCNEALYLHSHYDLHAGIDISDGLSTDLTHIVDESRCGAVIDSPSVPVSDAARTLSAVRADGRSPLDHALNDGEDFELLLAAPPATAAQIIRDTSLGVLVTDIGEFVTERGLWLVEDGERRPLSPGGYQHRFDP